MVCVECDGMGFILDADGGGAEPCPACEAKLPSDMERVACSGCRGLLVMPVDREPGPEMCVSCRTRRGVS